MSVSLNKLTRFIFFVMPIILTRHLAPAEGGSSQAQILADENGNKFYVKFKENAQALKVLANEFVAGEIAKKLTLPYPESFVVELIPELAPILPPINGNNISVGPHFGSAMVRDVYRMPGRQLISQCSNKSDFPLIILFDLLLYNTDRCNDGNYLIVSNPNGFKFFIIDHGHCFSSTWDVNSINSFVGQWSSFLPEMYETINAHSNMELAIQKIESLDDNYFTNLVVQIPNEWLPNVDERDALRKYLIDQRNSIRQMIELNKNKFPNWQ